MKLYYSPGACSLSPHIALRGCRRRVGGSWRSPVGCAPCPNLVAYRERVAARPAVQQAMRAEGLLR